MLILIFSGCGGMIVPSEGEGEGEGESEEMIFIIDTNPISDLICMASIEDGDNLMVLGQKDTYGNILDVDGTAFINELGEGLVIEIDDNGYPTQYIDSDGNKITYENYTQSTVDVSVYDFEDNLIEGPTTVNFDPNLLTELIQNYNNVKGTRTVRNLARNGTELMHFIADTIPIGWVLIEAAACGLSFSIPPLAEAVCSAFLLDLASLIIEEGDPDKINKLSLLLDTADIGIDIIDTGEGYTASFFGVQGNAANFVADLLDYSAVITDIRNAHLKFIQALDEQNWQSALINCVTDSQAYNEVEEVQNAFSKAGLNDNNSKLTIYNDHQASISIKDRPIAKTNHDVTISLTIEGIPEILSDASVYTEFYEAYDNKWRLTKSGILDFLLEELDQDMNETNQPPEITSTPATSATEGQPYSYDVNATDPDVEDSLTYSLTTKPTGMSINSSTGLIIWTPTTFGDYDVTVEVSDGELSDTQSFTINVDNDDPSTLPAPTILASQGTIPLMVYIDWISVTGATHYHLYRATSETGTKTAIGNWTSKTNYYDTDVTKGTHYFYFVKAATDSIGSNASDYSDCAEGWSKSETSNLKVPVIYDPGNSVSSGTPYTVSWSNESGNGALKYNIMESTSTSGSVYSVYGTSKEFVHSVDEDTTYYYKVRAYYDEGWSEYSDKVDMVVKADVEEDMFPAPTLYPIKLEAYAEIHQIMIFTLSWSAVDGADEYRVEQSINSSNPSNFYFFWTYSDIPDRADSETIEEEGKTLYFRVRAQNSNTGKIGYWSNIKSIYCPSLDEVVWTHLS